LPQPPDRAELAQILDGMGVVTWEYDHRIDRFATSPRQGELSSTGFADAVDCGRRELLARIHADDRDMVEAALLRADPSHAGFDVRYRFRTADGAWTWHNGRGRVIEWDDRGRPSRSVGIVVDISADMRRDALLRIQQEFARLLADAPDREALLTSMLDTALIATGLEAGAVYGRRPDGGYRLIARRGLGAAPGQDAVEFGPGTAEAAMIGAGEIVCRSTQRGDNIPDIRHLCLPDLGTEGHADTGVAAHNGGGPRVGRSRAGRCFRAGAASDGDRNS
jgi:hypothetical protein